MTNNLINKLNKPAQKVIKSKEELNELQGKHCSVLLFCIVAIEF